MSVVSPCAPIVFRLCFFFSLFTIARTESVSMTVSVLYIYIYMYLSFLYLIKKRKKKETISHQFLAASERCFENDGRHNVAYTSLAREEFFLFQFGE